MGSIFIWLVFNFIGKKAGDPLFDLLDTSKLNAHLKELMPGLTAKVFRTYNASITLDEMVSSSLPSNNVSRDISKSYCAGSVGYLYLWDLYV